MNLPEDKLYDLRLRLLSDPVNRKILDSIIESSKYPDDVARTIGFTRSALEQRLSKLIEAGFIRKAVEQESQKVLLIITPEGKDFRNEISKLYLQVFSKASAQEAPSEEKVLEPANKAASNKIFSKLSIPMLVFILFESIAIISAYNNFITGFTYFVILSWLFWTIIGIVVAKLFGRLKV